VTPSWRPYGRCRSADEATTWDTFSELYTLADVLAADRTFGPWPFVKADATRLSHES
jgi:hypothetical protein